MPHGVFSVEEFNGYVSLNSSNISFISAVLGVPLELISLAIAREVNNKTYDSIAHIAFDQFFKQPSNFLNSDATIRAELLAIPPDGIVAPFDRYNYLSLRDVGPGKIQIRTAIALLSDYAQQFPNDPLGIAHFQSDYGLLAAKLSDWSSEASAVFAGLMLLRGRTFLSDNVAGWNSWTFEEQQASLVAYYSRGEARILDLIGAATNLDGLKGSILRVGEAGEDFLSLYNQNQTAVISALAIGADGGAFGPRSSDYGAVLNLARLSFRPGNPFAITEPEYQLWFWGQQIKCFAGDTPIAMADGSVRPICEIKTGDAVATFDSRVASGRGSLSEGRVARVLRGTTTEWIVLDGCVRVTPDHRFLRPDGTFSPIRDIVAGDGLIVDSHGDVRKVKGSIVRASDVGSGAQWCWQEGHTIGGAVAAGDLPCFSGPVLT